MSQALDPIYLSAQPGTVDIATLATVHNPCAALLQNDSPYQLRIQVGRHSHWLAALSGELVSLMDAGGGAATWRIGYSAGERILGQGQSLPAVSGGQLLVTVFEEGDAIPAGVVGRLDHQVVISDSGQVNHLAVDANGNIGIGDPEQGGGGQLLASNGAATNALAVVGHTGAAMYVIAAAPNNLNGTLVPEQSTDNGVTWQATWFIDPATGGQARTLVLDGLGTTPTRGIVLYPQPSHFRVRVSAYTSGSSTVQLLMGRIATPVVAQGPGGDQAWLTNMSDRAARQLGAINAVPQDTIKSVPFDVALGASATLDLVTAVGGQTVYCLAWTVSVRSVGATTVSLEDDNGVLLGRDDTVNLHTLTHPLYGAAGTLGHKVRLHNLSATVAGFMAGELIYVQK